MLCPQLFLLYTSSIPLLAAGLLFVSCQLFREVKLLGTETRDLFGKKDEGRSSGNTGPRPRSHLL